MNLFDQLRAWYAGRLRMDAEKVLLVREGFVAFCTCRAPLNDSHVEPQGDNTYIYTCACGFKSRFLFGTPAPLLIQAWDREGLEIPAEGQPPAQESPCPAPPLVES